MTTERFTEIRDALEIARAKDVAVNDRYRPTREGVEVYDGHLRNTAQNAVNDALTGTELDEYLDYIAKLQEA